ncbi:MAG TPA: hypothetical protein P5134_05005 [Bacteroidales bacterium]|nr:hypothetical protein [Bacteroidales bacterium]
MTISRVEKIIEKRFQIKMTRNRSYQLLWQSGNEKILILYIRSDYVVIKMIKVSTVLTTTFANERELNQILNAFVSIAGELNIKKEK